MSIIFDKQNGVNGKPEFSAEESFFAPQTVRERETEAFASRGYRFTTRQHERHANETFGEPRQVNLAPAASPLTKPPDKSIPAFYSAKDKSLQKAGPAAFFRGQRLSGREIETLWNEILLLRRQSNVQVIGLASAQSGEGTSTILANLALEVKEFEWPILLVDLNVVHPHLAELFSFNPAPGFIDLLKKRCEFYVAARVIVPNKLYLLPLGCAEKDGGLNWEITARALQLLKEYFGLILVDLPPLSENTHALHLTCATDGVIQVVQAETTRIDAVKAVKHQLERLNVRMFGTVLNRRQLHIPKFLYKNF